MLLWGCHGSGKTSTAQYLVMQALKRGENVWSNMALAGANKIDINEVGNYDFFVPNEEYLQLPDNDKLQYLNEHRGGLLIIDEAGIAVNSRNWQSIPKSLVEFLKLHRHYKMDVYFFSQGDDIDMTIKRLAQRWYKLVRYPIPFISKRYSIAIPVVPNLVISDGGEWKIKYTPIRVPFQRKWLPIYKTWHLFNSYETPPLPLKNWEKWGEVYTLKKFNFNEFINRQKRIIGIKWYRFLNKRIKNDFKR